MSSKTKAEIKAFFETGDKPTEAQFIDFIDSYVDKSGPVGDIETAASGGTTGFAFCSGGNGDVINPEDARLFLGVTVYTTAQVVTVVGQNFTTTAAALAAGAGTYTTSAEASSVATDAINAKIATTAQATAAASNSVLITPILAKKVADDRNSAFHKTTSLTQSAGQNISDTTWTSLTFNTETADDGDWHSTVSDTSKVTVDETGYYIASGYIELSHTGAGDIGAAFAVNGTRVAATFGDSGSLPENHKVMISATLPLNSGDYIELQVYQNTGDTRATVTTGTRFSVSRLR